MLAKNKSLWRLSGAVLAIVLSYGLVKSHLLWQSTHFSCVGEMTFQRDGLSAESSVQFVFEGDSGVALVRGKIMPVGEPEQMINQNVFFEFTRNGKDYLLTSESVQDSMGAALDQSLLKKAFPLFYLQPNVQFYLNIERMAGNSWLFTTSRVPSLVCSRQP